MERKSKTALKNMEWCKYCSWYDNEDKECSVMGHPDDFGNNKTLSHTALCFLNWQLNKLKQRIKFAVNGLLKEIEEKCKEWQACDYYKSATWGEVEEELKNLIKKWFSDVDKEVKS